jgi:hypothetical protein
VGRACGCVCLVIASQGLIRFDSDLYAHRAEVGSTPKLRSRAREMLTQLATDAMLRPSLLVFARARLAPERKKIKDDYLSPLRLFVEEVHYRIEDMFRFPENRILLAGPGTVETATCTEST